MNRIITFIVLIITITSISCGPRKKVQATPTTTSKVVDQPPSPKDPYVPFTREIYTKLLTNRIDIKKLQFFVDQELVLSRGLDNGKIEVTSGVLKILNGKYINEIIIPIYTPGVCELVEGDGLRVSFEKGGQTFKFLNSRQYSPENFIFTGTNWKDGSCEVDYDNNKYRVNCGSCASVSDAKLVIKQSDIDKNDTKSRRIGGNIITN